jgi:hypothetical protein
MLKCLNDRYLTRTCEFLQVVLVALRADAYHQPWSHLLHHISPAQATVRQLQGHCFRKLIFGTNMLLDAFWNEWTDASGCVSHGGRCCSLLCTARVTLHVCAQRKTLTAAHRFDNATLALRKPALQAAQRFLMSSALTHKLQHLPPGENRARVAAEGCARIADTAAAHAESARSNRTAGIFWGCIVWLLQTTLWPIWTLQEAGRGH